MRRSVATALLLLRRNVRRTEVQSISKRRVISALLASTIELSYLRVLVCRRWRPSKMRADAKPARSGNLSVSNYLARLGALPERKQALICVGWPR